MNNHDFTSLMRDTSDKELLDRLSDGSSLPILLAQSLNLLSRICAALAKNRGFHNDERRLLGMVRDSQSLQWLEDAILQAELARQASEIGEAIEAVRKPGPDPHCPLYPAFLIEEADTIIRIADTCGKRNYDLGNALVSKLLYNLSRPYKHGKRS